MATLPASFGRRLRQARVAQRMTLDDLALRLGGVVTKAAISKYELGRSTPRPFVLTALSRALGLPAADLIGVQEHAGPIEWLAYRKHSRLGLRERERIEARAERRAEAQMHLLRLLHPDFQPHPPENRPAITPDEAEAGAEGLRREWNLGDGPIDGLIQVVEERGGIVVAGPEANRFDALSGRTPAGFFVIVLNLTRTADRIRFNVAHELGHLTLSCRTLQPKDEEQLAHRFAAALIVPAAAARRELGARRSNLSSTELEYLKRKYGLSVAAWTRRARDLGIIPESHFRTWQIALRSKGQHLRESVQYEREEQPKWMGLLCAQALSERVIDQAWLRTRCPDVAPPGTLMDPRSSAIRTLLSYPPEQRRSVIEAMSERAASDYERDPEIRDWLEFHTQAEAGDED
jgi:Zn-dependent peptidase ImmA (M78 family)